MSSVVPVFAPLAGQIGSILVQDGSTVNAGDILLVQSVTKTETNVPSPSAGRVKLFVQQGAEVNQGDRLAEISV